MLRGPAVAAVVGVLLALPAFASAGPGKDVASELFSPGSHPQSANWSHGPPTDGRPFDIGVRPAELYRIMYLHGGETKSANFTIRNIGMVADTAILNFTTDRKYYCYWKLYT